MSELIKGIEEAEVLLPVASEQEVEVAVIPDSASTTDRLIMMAVQGGADLDKLERLIDLKNREEDRMAKTEYDKNFSLMQAEFTAVSRDKQGHEYKYAPIETLQKHFGPTIAKYCFSYKWKEENIENGGKRCTMTVSGHGHSEENWFDVPKLDGTKIMNPVQVAGAMSTYGRRYTFISGFGLIMEDEDDDGAGFDEGVKYASYIEIIDTTEDHKELYEKVAQFVKDLRAKGDNTGADIVKKYYVKRKEALG